MPPAMDAMCTSLADWVAGRIRWSLTSGTGERAVLGQLASTRADTTVCTSRRSDLVRSKTAVVVDVGVRRRLGLRRTPGSGTGQRWMLSREEQGMAVA